VQRGAALGVAAGGAPAEVEDGVELRQGVDAVGLAHRIGSMAAGQLPTVRVRRMAPRRPGPGELLAGASGLLLLLAMFLPWFGLNGRARVPGVGVIEIGAGNLNAWEAFAAIDVVLAAAAALAIAFAVTAAFTQPPPPLALAVIGVAGLAALLIVFRLIDPPDIHVEASNTAYETARRLGAFFGLLCMAGMTCGAN